MKKSEFILWCVRIFFIVCSVVVASTSLYLVWLLGEFMRARHPWLGG